MNLEEVNVRRLVTEVQKLLNVQLRLKEKVYLICTVAEDVPEMIESDYQRLKQILINLLRNSTKFTFSGYIVLRVSCKKLSLKKDDKVLAIKNAVEFEVYDTGIGISKDNQENLFKIFGKVMQKNKSINKEGIGLGLYITRNLAIELGGTISVSSEEGVFTSFVVTLPIIQDL